METKETYSAEQKREIGKVYFFNSDIGSEERNYGLKLIMEACFNDHDAEATYIAARLILNGMLKVPVEDQNEYGVSLMCASANSGYIQARTYLNAYCEKRYHEQINNIFDNKHIGPLVDFEGKPIKINRQGIFTPIDAVLEYENGRNILTLSANIMLIYDVDAIKEPKKFENAVYNGLFAWQGDYEVFGGQNVSVRVKLTNDDKIFDSLYITTLTNEIGAKIQSISNVIGSKEGKKEISEIISNKRSFAISGRKWSATSRKWIYLQSKDGLFNDYEEIMHVTKHEFGHALGLGDLYASKIDSLAGVEKGTYVELDGYAINDRYYNLVMCDHRGPISNNDIEMVILAFRENKMQLYQLGKIKGKISSALGKGN